MNVLAWNRARRAHTLPSVLPRTRAYAIGDIHGRRDLLVRLHETIMAEIVRVPLETQIQIVYLGDYVDRGPESRQVINALLATRIPGVETVHLLGNHEQALLDFLSKPETGPGWLFYGGDATLASYGITVHPMAPRTPDLLARLARALTDAMPAEHLAFLNGLSLSHENGDYFFVHAGIDPKRPLDRQDPQDLIWIRDGFTNSNRYHGKVVVHGHTIAPEPVMRPNRIGIDTGAYVSGKLTCLVLEGTECRFLTT